MSSANYTIHTGWWTDWSQGSVRASTLTLDSDSSKMLQAFIAFWITFIAERLWIIVAFVVHQFRAAPGMHDGLYYQIQVVWRNTSTPLDAVVVFFSQAVAWRKLAKRVPLRTLGFASYGVMYFLAIAAGSTLLPQLLESTTNLRLIRANQCGWWTPNPSAPAELRQEALAAKLADDSLAAARYARNCYNTNETSPGCGHLLSSSIPWTSTVENPCPFRNQSLCLGGHKFQMESRAIDSHVDLGINTPQNDRVLIYQASTCAPLPTTEFARVSDDENFIQYNYGPLNGVQNFTYAYLVDATRTAFGYTVFAHQAKASRSSEDVEWIPLSSLQVSNADFTIFFLAFNSIYFTEPCDDPVFAAHEAETSPINREGSNGTFYNPDRVVSTIACIEQSKICNPTNNACTPFVARSQILNNSFFDDIKLSGRQRKVATRLANASDLSSLRESVRTRQSTALRAQEKVLGSMQLPLPAVQWQVEVGSWFEEGLSRLQLLVQEYAAPKPINEEGGRLVTIQEDATVGESGYEDDLCQNQLTYDTQGTQSFSALGLGLFFGITLLIMIVSYRLESIFKLLQRCLPVATFGYKQERWRLDEKLQLHGNLLSSQRLGEWNRAKLGIPVTTEKEEFALTNLGAYRSNTSVRTSDEEDAIALSSMTNSVHH